MLPGFARLGACTLEVYKVQHIKFVFLDLARRAACKTGVCKVQQKVIEFAFLELVTRLFKACKVQQKQIEFLLEFATRLTKVCSLEAYRVCKVQQQIIEFDILEFATRFTKALLLASLEFLRFSKR